MESDIIIRVILEGIESAVKGLMGMGEAAKTALSEMTEAADTASESVDKVTKKSEEASTHPSGLSGFKKTAYDVMQGLASALPEDEAKKWAQRIDETFSAPLEKVPGDAKAAGDSLRGAGEGATKALEGGAAAARSLVLALEGLSAPGAVAGLQALTSAATGLVGSLGEAGASVAGSVATFAALAAAVGGVDLALGVLAHSASQDIIALSDLGKSAGLSVRDMYALKDTMTSLGFNGENFARVFRVISVRIQTDWPQIQRTVRDSTDNIEKDLLRIADAERAVSDAQAAKDLAPVKLKQAELGVSEAERSVAQAKAAQESAALAVEDAMIGQVRAAQDLKEAELAVVDAQRESNKAALDLNDALIEQKKSTFAVRDAQLEVNNAQQEQRSAQTGLASANLSYAEAKYQYDLKYNFGIRDSWKERDFAKARDTIALEQKREAVVSAQTRVDSAPEKIEKALLNLAQAQQAQPRADIAVKEAQERVIKAADGQERAALNLVQAGVSVEKSSLALDTAKLSLTGAGDNLQKAALGLSDAVEGLRKAAQDLQASADKLQAAQVGQREAQRAYEDDRYKRIPEVARSLFPSPQDKREGNLLDLTKVDPSVINSAITYHAGQGLPGGRSPTTTEVLLAVSQALQNQQGNPALTNMIGRSFMGPFASPSDIAALAQGPEAIQRGTQSRKNQEEGQKVQELVPQALAERKAETAALSSADYNKMVAGMEASKVIIPQLQGLTTELDKLPDKVRDFSKSLQDLSTTFDQIRPLTDAMQITTPAPQKPATPGMSDEDRISASYAAHPLDRTLNMVLDKLGGHGIADFFDRMNSEGKYANVPGGGMADKTTEWKILGESSTEMKSATDTFSTSTKSANSEFSSSVKEDKLSSTEMKSATDSFSTSVRPLTDLPGSVLSFKSATTDFSSSVEKFSQLQTPQQPAPEHRAFGGLMRGPGGPTGDRIPALLSDGEFVLRSAAVQHWGVDTLHSMNEMRSIRHFSIGGMVSSSLMPSAPSSRQADGSGGGLSGFFGLDLRTDQGSFPVMVSEGTLQSIKNSAMKAKLTSTGTKPSHYR